MAGVGTNRYAYSFNDPVNKMDPSGNTCVPCGRAAAWLAERALNLLFGGTAAVVVIAPNVDSGGWKINPPLFPNLAPGMPEDVVPSDNIHAASGEDVEEKGDIESGEGID